MIKMDSKMLSLQDCIQRLCFTNFNGYSKKNLEAQIKSQAKNASPHAGIGELYLDYSPSGSYVGLSDTIAISSEAYQALRKAHHAEIDKIIERGESLELKGISYEDYSYYIGFKGSFPDKSTYKLLCYEGKTRAYFTEKAIDIYDRWAEGEDFPEEELNKWTQYACDYYTKAEYRRRLNQNANRLTDALAENGFVLGKDEKLDIKLSSNATYTVSGIEDEGRRQKIEEIANKTLSNLLLHGYMNLPHSPADSWIPPNATAYQSSWNLGFAEKYLRENTDGVTLSDLYLDSEENICGALPQETLDKLNSAFLKIDANGYQRFTEEERFWFDNKTAIQDSIKAIKTYGYDYQNLPCINYHFAYKNGELSVVDGR